jgi:hypothetical protein
MGNTQNRTISLSPEVEEHIKQNFRELTGMDFSSWIEQLYRKEFLSISTKVQALGQKRKESRRLEHEIALLRKYDKEQRARIAAHKKSPLSKAEMAFFGEYGLNLGNPDFRKGQIAAYRQKFQVILTEIQFLERIEKFRKQ